MTEDRCPYCLSPIEVKPKPLNEKLTNRQWVIYKAVLDAGPQGASSKDLLGLLADGRRPGTLRTCIYTINQIINPMRLAGRGGRYFLERVKWSEEGIE